MILIIESFSGDRKVYRLENMESLAPVFERYPSTKTIAMVSQDLDHAAHDIADYLNSQHLTAWVESDLNKNVGHKIAALGMLASSLLSPHAGVSEANQNPSTMSQAIPKADAMGKHPADAFLWNIRQIESSGGSNVDHDPISHGQFKGQKAMGRWGLLKPTVVDIIKRAKAAGKLSPDMAALETMPRDTAHKFLMKHPHTELKMVRLLANHVLSRHGGDMQRAAYSWLNGHNLSSDRIHSDQLAASDYVQKFNKYHAINPYKGKLKPSLAAKSLKLEAKPVFKARLHSWLEKHPEKIYQDRRSIVQTNDYGRVREEELDEQDRQPVSAVDKIRRKLDTVK